MDRPQQHRGDARLRSLRKTRVANDQERKSKVAPIDACIALEREGVARETAKARKQALALSPRRRIEADGCLHTAEKMIENRVGWPERSPEIGEINACSGLADGQANERPALNLAGDALLEVLEKRRDVLLLRRFRPLCSRDSEKHSRSRERYAPFDPERRRPLVQPGYRARGKTRGAQVHVGVDL